MAVSRLSQQSIQQSFPKGTTLWDGTTATSAFDSLGSFNVSSATSSVTFSSIPQTYQHLQIRFSVLGSSNNDDFQMQFNGITASSNYSWKEFRGNGTTATIGSGINQSFMYVASNSGDSSYPTVGIIDIHDYTNTNKAKTVRIFEGNSKNATGTMSLWASSYFGTTNAVSSIKLYHAASNINPNSVISLYGIK
jgi:hypothetical protein